MAQFRIDQAAPGPGAGDAGISRHDLAPDAVVTLTATEPLTVGTTYAWEIVDKVGSAAVLSSASGSSVTFTIAALEQPCAFLIKMTATDGTSVTSTMRIASVRTAVAGLRVPLFREASSAANSLSSHDVDLSTDNATYNDLAGLGATEQNWRGWAEWAREVVDAIEVGGGGGGGTLIGDVTGAIGSNTVEKIRGLTIDAAISPSSADVLQWDGSKWAATPLAPVGTTSMFVLHVGGTEAGNVYTSWASLYAAASAVAGPITVWLATNATISGANGTTFALQGWTFRGDDTGLTRRTLGIDGNIIISGDLCFERLLLVTNKAPPYAGPFILSGATQRIDLLDTDVTGFSSTYPVMKATGGTLVVNLRGASSLGIHSGDISAGGAAEISFYDSSSITTDAINGSFGGTVQLWRRDKDVLLRALVFPGNTVIKGPEEQMLLLDAAQLGVVSSHVGSIYLAAGTRLLRQSAAMLGAIDGGGASAATLDLKRYTDASLLASWSTAAALGDTQLAADVSVANSDWYDLYVYTGNVLDTAVLKGLRLLSVKE